MSAVSMFYYLRLVVAMYLREGKEADFAITPSLKVVAATCLAITLLLGLWPTPLINQATSSSNGIARAALIPHAGR
jgi:NADH:ubiquinone oxidoreductase subunit 2 (subunit N)